MNSHERLAAQAPSDRERQISRARWLVRQLDHYARATCAPGTRDPGATFFLELAGVAVRCLGEFYSHNPTALACLAKGPQGGTK